MTKYSPSLGIYKLREEIAKYYYKKYRVNISPEQVIITSGTSPALLLIFSVLLNTSDEVILSKPYYACYPNFIKYLDAIPSYFPLFQEEGFVYDIKRIKKKINKRTKAIIVNSPGNPTGVVLEKEILENIANLGKYVVSDEIYHGLVYEGEEHTILEFTENAFVINGFSKKYAMTGWRLGYLIAPKKFVRAIQKLAQNLYISTNTFVQYAGITALKETEKEVEKMKNIYKRRRDYLIKGLKNLGFPINYSPAGAFYILVDCKKFSPNSYKLSLKILEKLKVAITPGEDFGAKGFLRFSYATNIGKIKEGLKRLSDLPEIRD
jgi:aspartate/methionine/tyrosine aminotransferase